MSPGKQTAHAAHWLIERMQGRNLVVLSDHKIPELMTASGKGKIRCSHEVDGVLIPLAHLDIALASKYSNKVYALIEIEETTDNPKTLLGDLFATLLGTQITFQGRQLEVGPWTTLIVLAHGTGQMREKRITLLQKHVRLLKDAIGTSNAIIGKIVVGLFVDEADLRDKLVRYVNAALSDVNMDSE